VSKSQPPASLGVVTPFLSKVNSPKNELCMRENKSQSVAVLSEEGVTPLLCHAKDFYKEWIHLQLEIPKLACSIRGVRLSLKV